jgi:chemotaxis protein MotB
MSKKNRGHGGGHGNSERWLMTYADLMNNLLALFIVMYMMGVTDLSKFQKVIASFANTFGNAAVTQAASNTPDMINEADMDEESLNAILAAGEGATMPEIIPSEEEEAAEEAAANEEGADPEATPEVSAAPEDSAAPEESAAPEDSAAPEATGAPADAINQKAAGAGGGVSAGLDGTGDAYDELVHRISDLLKAKGYDKNVSVEMGGDYIYLRFREGVLFLPDEAVMKDGASTVLSNISTVILDSYDLISNIDISGHTARIPNNLPSKENLFSWELSTNRALTVLEYLVRKCDMPQEKLSVTGNSCNKLYVEGESEEDKSLNRRVEIRLTRAMTGDQSIDVLAPGQAQDNQANQGTQQAT